MTTTESVRQMLREHAGLGGIVDWIISTYPDAGLSTGHRVAVLVMLDTDGNSRLAVQDGRLHGGYMVPASGFVGLSLLPCDPDPEDVEGAVRAAVSRLIDAVELAGVVAS